MSKLTYEELILLDNLIYLEWNAEEDELLINIVDNLLGDNDFDNKMKSLGNCIIKMKESEWINILEQIKNKDNLQTLKIKNVSGYNNGMKFACFIDDENNAVVVFRGTVTEDEWDDNGIGVYEGETLDQIEALNYINSLEYDNITVTGHSKGGNKAQFVAILSQKIVKCVSINGQGFSNEFMYKYSEEINKNKAKILCINAKYDYVNCLFNSVSGKNYYINTEIQINPSYYHKANILLDDSGNLRKEASESMFSKSINYFSESIILSLPNEIKRFVIDKFIDIVELFLCEKEGNNNPLKVLGEFLIMFFYENIVNYQEIFNISYLAIEILILPVLFWDDFISAEENNSTYLLDNIIESINILGNGIIKKMEIVDKNQISLINGIRDAIDKFTYNLTMEKNKML